MIIHINSYPGVGKLTIAKALSKSNGAKILDNHSIYNVAFALTEFKSPEFYKTVSDVRAIAYQRVKELPSDVPVILTNAHVQDSSWGNACWDEALKLAKSCKRAHVVVILDCSREENSKRIQGVDREDMRKPRDPQMFRQGPIDRPLIDRDADHLIRMDVTNLSAQQVADHLHSWLDGLPIR